MTAVFAEVLEVSIVLLAGWVTIFGGTNALYARRRGFSPLNGLLLGSIFGPAGWLLVWSRTTDASSEEEARFEQALDELWRNL